MPSERAFTIEVSPNWRVLEEALTKGVKPIMDEEQILLTRGAALDAVLVARGLLDEYVYDAPLPPSAYKMGIDRYLEKSRVGRTRGAIKADPPALAFDGIAARAYVDRSDYPAFFYALSLEFGMLDRFPTYYPRPFWHGTKLVMQGRYREAGTNTARRITTRILGRFV